MNKVRIIGGTWRSRILTFPDSPGLRPTPDRVRETVFNWLGQDLSGKSCLDLFAGSGAMGFEAASRGAESVLLVENNRAAHAALLGNAQKLDANQITILAADALKFASADTGKFDVIFLDPPYRQKLLPQLLPLIAARLNPQGLVYVESDSAIEPADGFEIWRSGKAGGVYYQLLKVCGQR